MAEYDQLYSYVSPSNYNWINNSLSDASQNHYPISSTNILMPWLLSIWVMGNKAPSQWSKKSRSLKKFKKPNRSKYTGLQDYFVWSQVDLEFPNEKSRKMAIKSGVFIPENNLPLGLEIWKSKMFLSLPQWKNGIPVTLSYVDLKSSLSSPKLKPYPNWNWYANNSDRCQGLVSVFRMEVDKCNRLWVLDTGAINLANQVDQVCPVKLDVFDLKTDRHIRRFPFPTAQAPKNSLFTNIVVEVVNNDCENAFAYMSDVFQYGLVVYSYKKDASRRIFHPYFYPDPLHCRYEIDGITFHWVDGIFGMCLSAGSNNRILYFHAMSSNNEFYVPTSSLRNDSLGSDLLDHFVSFNDSRCHKHQSCQASASTMDPNGVMYYNIVSTGKVGCWNTKQELNPYTQGIIDQGSTQISFPNDIKVDKDSKPKIWMLSNGLHKYLYNKMNPNEINIRVMMAFTDKVTKGTVCDPTL